MDVIDFHPTIENLFQSWREPLGQDYVPYRNHVYRVFNFSVKLADADGDLVEKLAVVSAFHDIGIWLDRTFDYIEPSVLHASEFLLANKRCSWISSVAKTIREHHKLLPWIGNGSNLVESFRRADWLDVCFVVFPTKLETSFTDNVLQTFPRSGFHFRLACLALPWILRHPLRPLPMFKL